MSAMYKAIQVTKPGEFATVMKPLVDPGPGQVRIQMQEAVVCGRPESFQAHHIGGRNMNTVENRWFGFVLVIALLFFCILAGLVVLLA